MYTTPRIALAIFIMAFVGVVHGLWGSIFSFFRGSTPNMTAPPAPGSLKALLFPPLLNEVRNKGTQGVQARYGAELPPFISIVRYPGRPVILGMERNFGVRGFESL